MQVIDPTFAAYRARSLPNNIWDAKANIFAGSNYAVKRYGSLAAIDPKNKPGGYDQGGWMQPGRGEHVNGTAKPEAVLNHQQWSDIAKLAHRVSQMVTADDLRGVHAAKGAHIVVNNNQHYVYDQRSDFSDAEITVVSQDPDEMGRKLAAKAVTDRVNQTRGVRR
jgi:SLT domain-containing protein